MNEILCVRFWPARFLYLLDLTPIFLIQVMLSEPHM